MHESIPYKSYWQASIELCQTYNFNAIILKRSEIIGLAVMSTMLCKITLFSMKKLGTTPIYDFSLIFLQSKMDILFKSQIIFVPIFLSSSISQKYIWFSW